MSTPQERKFRRFTLSCPVRLKFVSGAGVAEEDAVCRNVSIGGMLLNSASLIPCGSPIEFTIILQKRAIARPIKLLGAGRVVRVEPCAVTCGFRIAVACAQPIAQMMEGVLSVTA